MIAAKALADDGRHQAHLSRAPPAADRNPAMGEGPIEER